MIVILLSRKKEQWFYEYDLFVHPDLSALSGSI
jgi:hypothetical protein